MVFKTRKRSMAWREHALLISLKQSAPSVKDKMAPAAFGRATNYGCDNLFNSGMNKASTNYS